MQSGMISILPYILLILSKIPGSLLRRQRRLNRVLELLRTDMSKREKRHTSEMSGIRAEGNVGILTG
jgi:hypothetical protein